MMLSTLIETLPEAAVANPIEVDLGNEDGEYSIAEETSNESISCSRYTLKPLAYTTKYGAKALSVTTMIASCTLILTSYAIADMSYLPRGMARVTETIRGENNEVDTFCHICHNSLNSASSITYYMSYIHNVPGRILKEIYFISDKADSLLTPETIDNGCMKVDSYVHQLCNTIAMQNRPSSRLRGATHVGSSITNHHFLPTA
ncbi:hypothetical protein BIY23_00720 [Wolbachia pipientis]|uniref:Uncharacterized protein n=1 Tax=Wolbachia pipientis TaxID=955 RepID=A0A1E7QKM7_WOLPI|nr:hypothetical protein [Wolbachia pipientis]OEY87003.1 hypothetical protein BIY23_00720 [Wolbachia pipientis]